MHIMHSFLCVQFSSKKVSRPDRSSKLSPLTRDKRLLTVHRSVCFNLKAVFYQCIGGCDPSEKGHGQKDFLVPEVLLEPGARATSRWPCNDQSSALPRYHFYDDPKKRES